jgi:hypothetical protein
MKYKMLYFSMGIVWLCCMENLCSASGQPAEIHQTFSMRLPDVSVPKEQTQPVPQGLKLVNSWESQGQVIDLGPVSAAQVEKADAEAARDGCPGPVPPRTGLVRPVSIGIGPGFKTGSGFQAVTTAEGRKLWMLSLRSPGALGLRVHFRGFDVREGVAVVWTPDKDGVIVRGPYTGKGPKKDGEFWTESLPGDTVLVEVTGEEEPQLEVLEIVHIDRQAPGISSSDGTLAPSAATWCELDAMCYDASVVNPAARDAVVQLNFVSGSSQYLCSGTILNDLDNETVAPYLLTAYHCLHTQADVNTLEVVWFWQRASCGGTLPDYNKLPRVVGGTLLESNPTDGGNDMTFIRLASPLPSGASLAGWTTAYSNSSYGVHHPMGDWKRVTFFSDSNDYFLLGGCLFFDPTDYSWVKTEDGFIEGGSSGSPLLNSAGQVMGQLYGICCQVGHGLDCQGIDCSSSKGSWRNIYGQFESTYPIIKRWLEIGGTIHVDGAYTGTEQGTPSQPFNTVNEANNFAWDNAQIKVKAGSYKETLTFAKQLTIMADGGEVTIGP